MPDLPHARVLIVNATYHIGGAERVLQAIALHLRSRLDIHVCALYEPGTIGEQMAQSGLPLHALHGASRTDLRLLPRWIRLLKDLRPHTVLTVDSPIAVIYAALARRLGLVARLVVAVHAFGKTKRAREMAVARRVASGATDVLIALAPTHLQFLLEREHWRARETLVIPNGVDLTRFTPQGNHLREAWNLAPDTPAFGIVAGLRPEKNFFRFLRVADRVLSHLPEARAFVVGDGELRRPLEETARNLPHGARVTFTGAMEDVPAVWRTLDVAVLTSDTEVLPMTLIEASACGVPAVSTEVGAVRDVVLDGETGFVVPLHDEELLAERILQLLTQPDLRQQMGARARQHAESHFDLQKMIARYEEVLCSRTG